MYDRQESIALARRALTHLNNRTTDQAEAPLEVAAAGYSDPKHYEQEIEQVFRRSPLPLCFSVELPAPQSWRAMTVAGVPVLIVRGDDGVVRSFVNACRHRGSQLCKPGHGTARRFVCPYHAWQYSLDGQLQGIYGEDTFGEIDKKTHSLVPLPVAEKAGIVWGTLTPFTDFNIDEWLGSMAPLLERVDLGSWHIHVQREFDGPMWKAAWDGYLENYHHSIAHTSTVSRYTMGNLTVHDVFGRHQRIVFGRRSLHELSGVPEDQWEPDTHIRRVFHIFPNLAVSVMTTNYCLINQIFPGAAREKSVTRQTIMVRKKPETEAEKRDADEFAEVTISAIRDEDYPINEGVSVSLLSGRAANMVFGRNEPALQHYHRTLEATLNHTES